MTFTNLATNKILSGHDSHGVGIGLGKDFTYLKFAWELTVTDTNGNQLGLTKDKVLIAKTVELPRWSADTQIVNAYNHKTIVQTKFNWEPITISFYDQINKSAECLIWDFAKAQFDPSDASKKPDFKPLTLEIRMKNLSGDDEEDKVYTLTNAYIVDAQHDTLDYATSDIVLWTVTIRFEELEIKNCDWAGKAPDAKTGIAKQPEPEKPVNQENKSSSSQFVPQSGIVKPDAKPDTKPDAKSDGGPDTFVSNSAGAATGMTSSDARLETMASGTGVLAAKAKELIAERKKNGTWGLPSTPSPTGTIPFPGQQNSVPGQQNSDPSPSTGANMSASQAQANERREKKLAASNTEFVKQETEYVKNDKGMNPEYRKAYLEGLEKYPPRSSNLESHETSRKMAEAHALRTAPRYSAQTRTPNADGSVVDRAPPAGVQARREVDYRQARPDSRTGYHE